MANPEYRQAFIKLGLISIGALFVEGCKASNKLKSMPVPTITAVSSPYPPQTLTAEMPTASAAYKREVNQEWTVPSVAQIVNLNRNPAFWTDKLGKSQNSIAVAQGDKSQYLGSNFPIPFDRIVNNACSLAILTTVRRWGNYIYTGDIPSGTNITTVAEKLTEKYYQKRHGENDVILNTDVNVMINFEALAPALKILDDDTEYFRLVELTPDWSLKSDINGNIGLAPIPYEKWQDIFDLANKEVFSRGGISILFVHAYNWGHTILSPYFPESVNDSMLYFDPKGPDNQGVMAYQPLGGWKNFGYALGVVPNLD